MVAATSEKGFQHQVLFFAALCQWRRYHTWDARRSEPGYPDLTLVRGPRLVFAELKTETGRLSAAQRNWIGALGETPAEVYCWRPSDWADIQRVLR
jgi:hypothetical protein